LIEDGYAHSLKALLEKSRAEKMELAARRAQGDRIRNGIPRPRHRLGRAVVDNDTAALKRWRDPMRHLRV
jgi:hypothetical protein